MRARTFLGVVAFVAIACANEAAPGPIESSQRDAALDPSPPATPRVSVAAPEGALVHELGDPRLLDVWDGDGAAPLSLVRVLAHIHREAGLAVPELPSDAPAASADLLARFDGTWSVVASTLASDVERIVVDLGIDWEMDITRTYDPTAAKTEIGRDAVHRGNGNVARVLEPRWLRSADGRFLLAAAIYRPDRRDFLPGTCGEVRLVYRLGYAVPTKRGVAASRMPLTVNVVFVVPDDGQGCREAASQWRAEAVTDANATEVATALLAGPLALARLRFLQIELDAQVVRFPSDLENVEGRGFAGQAMYWLRIFALDGDRFRPILLENTPDVQAIRADPAKRAALLEFIERELVAIDHGVFRVPESLLADVALSWSTLGSARAANRPFASLITTAEADAIVARGDAGVRVFVGDGAGLLERLDAASCMGCHQSSSTAGFHLLGVDRSFGSDRDAVAHATDGNRLELAFSPHFEAERARRDAVLARLADGETYDITRPHPSAPPATWGAEGPRYATAGVNMPCVLDGTRALAPASRWSCAEGLACRAVAEDAELAFGLGQCVPPDDAVRAGLSCRAATLVRAPTDATDGIAWNVRAFADRVRDETPLFDIGEGALTAAKYNCRPSRIGVPLGRITRNCRAEERTLAAFATGTPPEVCAIVGGKGFEQMAMGVFDSHAFAAGVGRGLLDSCSPQRFCREDYICQQLPDFLHGKGVAADTLARLHREHVGFCTPTYFVYQLRLDGHPDPR